MILVDSHCHLDSLDYTDTDLPSVLEDAQKRNVKYCLSIATTLSGYQRLKDQVMSYPNVMLSCGIHPLNLTDEQFDLALFSALVAEKEVVGIGETGLDYYYQKENTQLQQERFVQHIELSKRVHKPVIVHTRNAKEDTLALLKNEKAESAVIHCFTEDIDMAKKVLDLGFYISISGIVTFNNAEVLRNVVKYIPLTRLLVETDSPYLAPVPYRGKQNKPAYVREIAEYIATLKGISVEEVANQTTHNFCQLFNQILN